MIINRSQAPSRARISPRASSTAAPPPSPRDTVSWGHAPPQALPGWAGEALLRRGVRGDAVKVLQQQLNASGSHLSEDGVFGPATQRAVQSYQAQHHLSADGVVGPQTRAAMGVGPGPVAGGWAARLPKNLKPHADDFHAAGEKYGVDPRFLAAIAMQESGGGTSPAFHQRNNAMGIMGRRGLARFPSVGASIQSIARDLSDPQGLYRGRSTIASIGARYCPPQAANDPHGLNAHWLPNVTRNYAFLGGDPRQSVLQRA